MAKKEFVASSLTMGQVNAIVKKLGGVEQALRFLRGELILQEVKGQRRWKEKESDMIYFDVMSKGRTGLDWLEFFESRDIVIDDDVREILLLEKLKVTKGVLREVVLVKTKKFTKPSIKNIRNYIFCGGNKFRDIDVETFCLIREYLSNCELSHMGLNWISTSRAFKLVNGSCFYLKMDSKEPSSLNALLSVNKDDSWDSRGAFAFAASFPYN
ncbi:hypothetical protein EOL94_02220 [bacterium]|nr:hypothetical protein [bacterium]